MTEIWTYRADDLVMIGRRIRPERPNGAGLLVAPAFAGLREFEIERAERLATLGYEVLAVDYHGDGWVAETMDQAAARMAEYQADRAVLLRRMQGALAEVQSWGVARIGGVGFCLGGKAVLDLGRSGATDAVVALHGVFDPPATPTQAMPPVLLCHGWNDPLAKPEDFGTIAKELEQHSSDWHALAFGQTGHAFTNPAFAGDAVGMDYVERSANRTWAAVDTFLADHLIPLV